jgi:FlaA1/EpsC-like NDP-sugar epimerase
MYLQGVIEATPERCAILECVAGAKIVIPGGSGYLGRALTEKLVARGDEVVILARGEAREGDG